MGVQNLFRYILTVKDAYTQINIKDKIEESKSETQSKPIIVFHLLCLANLVKNKKYDYFSGGRHNIFIEDFTFFFQQLRDCGVKLVFFLDGPLQEVKQELYCSRHDFKYSVITKILDDIYSEPDRIDSDFLLKKHSNDIPINSTVVPSLINLAMEFGELKKAYFDECDKEIADYAVKNNVLAVISDDTDFLVFDGDYQFWACRDLDLQNLTTMEYRKPVIRRSLSLSAKQMPLFATIYGNGFLNYVKVYQFHRKNVSSVVKYVKQFPTRLVEQDFERMARNIYGPKWSSDIPELIRNSLNSYNISELKIGRVELEDELLINAYNDHNGYIYEILKDMPIKITDLYFDFRSKDFKNYFDLIERLICRQMGVLLKHKNDPDLVRKVVIKKSHDDKYGMYSIKPEYPEDFQLPPLLKLLFDKNDEKIRSLKYRLICWILNDVIVPKKLLGIPKEYLITVLTLLYLLENKQIDIPEADAILKSSKIDENDVSDDLTPINFLNERALLLAFLFTKLYGHIKRCLCYVGLSDLIGDLKFDGKMFQSTYFDFCVTKMDRNVSMKDLDKYRIYDTLRF